MAYQRSRTGGRSLADAVAVVLAVVSGLIVAASLAVPNVAPSVAVLAAPESQVRQFFDVAGEANLPTWFSVLLLAFAAAAHLVAAVLARRARDPATAAWWVSSAVLAALSLDEATALHERLDELGRALPMGGDLTFAWVVPGAVIGAAVIVAIAQLARRLPSGPCHGLLLGLGLLLGGALVMETVNGAALAAWGSGPAYVLLTHTEELMEMLGAIALLRVGMQMARTETAGPAVMVSYAGGR